MTAYYEFEKAITSLNPAEAFAAASRIEQFSSRIRESEVKKLPNMLLTFAAASEGLDAMAVDQHKVDQAVALVASCTILEANEFTYLLNERPEYKPVQR